MNIPKKMKVVILDTCGYSDEFELPESWDTLTEEEQEKFKEEQCSIALESINVFCISEDDEDYKKY